MKSHWGPQAEEYLSVLENELQEGQGEAGGWVIVSRDAQAWRGGGGRW